MCIDMEPEVIGKGETMKRIQLIALLVVVLALMSVGGALAQGNEPAPAAERR